METCISRRGNVISLRGIVLPCLGAFIPFQGTGVPNEGDERPPQGIEIPGREMPPPRASQHNSKIGRDPDPVFVRRFENSLSLILVHGKTDSGIAPANGTTEAASRNAAASSNSCGSARDRILGLEFFNGIASEAVACVNLTGGCVVIPSSPALGKLRHDPAYRAALQSADFILLDSELVSAIWKIITGRRIRKISGIEYLRLLIADSGFRKAKTLWIVSSVSAREKALAFLKGEGATVGEKDFYVRAASGAASDHALLFKIEERKPDHIIIALRAGVQEELGVYLRDYLMYRPRIHCMGAALGFLSGEEKAIPEVLRRWHLAWLARFAAQPRLILPRLGIALTVALMLFRYRSELPPLRTRWTDV